MKRITDMEIRAYSQKLRKGEVPDKEFKEGEGRGAGRLVLSLRRGSEDVISEWYVQWHRDGQRRSTKIGVYPTLSLAEARKQFAAEFVPAILKGINPTGHRAWTRKKDGTVRDLFAAYIASLEQKGAKPMSIKGAKHALLGENGLAKALGEGRPANEIQSEDIVPYLISIHQRGAIHQANTVRVWAHAAFQFGLKAVHAYHLAGSDTDWGIKENPVVQIAVDGAAFVPRDRYLSEQEFAAFWGWLTEKGTSVRYRFAPAVQLCMATGQRQSEILRIKSADVDFEEGTVFWETTKNKRPHTIPLPSVGVEILEATAVNEHGYFFPSVDRPHLPAQHYTFEYIINRYLADTGATKFTARDLRRTWKTLAGAAGLSKDIRDRIQNHALTDVSAKHYDRYDYLREKRKAMDVWDETLRRILTGDPTGKVEFARPVRVSSPSRPRRDGLTPASFPPPM